MKCQVDKRQEFWQALSIPSPSPRHLSHGSNQAEMREGEKAEKREKNLPAFKVSAARLFLWQGEKDWFENLWQL